VTTTSEVLLGMGCDVTIGAYTTSRIELPGGSHVNIGSVLIAAM
jgi:hypothetical protein